MQSSLENNLAFQALFTKKPVNPLYKTNTTLWPMTSALHYPSTFTPVYDDNRLEQMQPCPMRNKWNIDESMSDGYYCSCGDIVQTKPNNLGAQNAIKTCVVPQDFDAYCYAKHFGNRRYN